MAVLENAVEIARSPADVFDYCSDLRNEREWTPGSMKGVEKLTDGPVGVGTRYLAEWQQGGLNTVEYTRFERPTSWEATSDSKMLGMVFQARVEPTSAGSRLIVRMDLRPHGLAKLGSAILRRAMQREEVRNLAAIKRTLETGPGLQDPEAGSSSRGTTLG